MRKYKLIMPKHTRGEYEHQAVLKIHYEKKDWVTSAELIQGLHEEYVRLGKEDKLKDDKTDYTKDAQIPRYFLLIRRLNPLDDRSPTIITEDGIKYYKCLLNGDYRTIYAMLINKIQNMIFGKNTQGCGSDSDIEPLAVFFHAVYDLQGINAIEYGYLSQVLDQSFTPYSNVIDEIRRYRNSGQLPPIEPESTANNLKDWKTIFYLIDLKMLCMDSAGKVTVAPDIDAMYHDVLYNLKMTTVGSLVYPFKKWLIARGDSNVESYLRSVEATTKPLKAPMVKNEKSWEGLYEYVLQEPPQVDIYGVTGRLDFDKKFHKFNRLFSRVLPPPAFGVDPERHQKLIDYTLRGEASEDKGCLYYAHDAYRTFLTWFDFNKFNLGFPEAKDEVMINTILAAIRTKPFILLAGISGTGKSRIVRQLARGCCPDDCISLINKQKPGNFEMIQVRPNWHDSTELIGYVSRITGKDEYQVTPFLKFLCKAWRYEREGIPFFLCLDEMNLAPVEQYFAEYLSIIETRQIVNGKIVTDPLVKFKSDSMLRQVVYDCYPDLLGKPEIENYLKMFKDAEGIPIPQNLVVMGTVNMDETTFSFSRKVLDRAMSFELSDVQAMYKIEEADKIEYGALQGRAFQKYVTAEDLYFHAPDEATAANNKKIGDKLLKSIEEINNLLEGTPFKIAYRSRNEIMLYCIERTNYAEQMLAKALDEAISMKILSRVEGDQLKLKASEKYQAPASYQKPPTPTLLWQLKVCILEELKKFDAEATEDKYPVCAKKLDAMMNNITSGFTGFWM